MDDPFFVVKAEVQNTMQTVDGLYNNWKRLLETTNTSGNDEFQWTTDELKKNLTNIEWDIQDLQETISIVRSNPEKFKLDRKEVTNREGFIADTKRKIESILAELSSPATKGKMERDQRESLMASSRRNDMSARLNKAREEDNDQFINQNSPQLLVREQDEALDQVHSTVKNLKQMAITIGGELEDHERLLEDVENRVDNTSGKLSTALKKVEKVYKESQEKGSLLCIGVLVIVIVILAILALTL